MMFRHADPKPIRQATDLTARYGITRDQADRLIAKFRGQSQKIEQAANVLRDAKRLQPR